MFSGFVAARRKCKSSSACDNTQNTKECFSNLIFSGSDTKRMPSLSRFMFRTLFAWAYIKAVSRKYFATVCDTRSESSVWKIKFLFGDIL